MRRLAAGAALLLAAGLGALLVLPAAIDPAPFHPPAPPPLEGPLGANDELARVELLGAGQLAGPEDVEPDAAGRLYCGTADGTIRRLDPAAAGGAVEIFARTGGRPLGLDLGRDGTLWVADSGRGLLAVDREGNVAVRVDHVGGQPVGYADDVDTAPDGRVYFSDASTRFSPAELHLEPFEARPWGRLVELDPATGEARVALDGLYFANGVAVAADGSFVLVVETFRYRLRRLWLRGPRAGQDEPFAANLPGFPDGVSADGRGGFWVTLFSPRVALLDRLLHPRPWLKRLAARLPAALLSKGGAYGLVLSLDAEGRYQSSLHDPGGERYPFVTSAEERGGHLYLGSTEADAIGRYRLRQAGSPPDRDASGRGDGDSLSPARGASAPTGRSRR